MNRTLDVITLILVVAGALNWLLVGLFGFDLVAEIAGREFGERNWFNTLIYILVGLSGIYQAAIVRTAHHWGGREARPHISAR